MRVAIIAHALRNGGGISIGKNTIAVLRKLAPSNEYFISIPANLGYEEICDGLPDHQVSIFDHNSNLACRYIYEAVKLPKIITEFNANIVLCLGNVAIKGIDAQQILLLHNAYYVYDYNNLGRKIKIKEKILFLLQRYRFRSDLKRVHLLICQTKTMMRRVSAAYNYRGRSEVIPNAVSIEQLDKDENYKFPISVTGARQERRLFYLTSYYTHKNIESIVDLFDKKRDALRDYVVILTFDPACNGEAIRLMEKINKIGLSDKIINVGPLSQRELAQYYTQSYALFMPTLLESFSSTYIEAMHYGLPILTSDFDFAREICGDAAIYFDPWDNDSMIDAITSVSAKRDTLIGNGYDRLHQCYMSWDTIGEKMISILEELAVQHR
jgi:glycosyltransferase involved in cell wall biosynthesis